MLCKFSYSRTVLWVMVAVGIVSAAFGIVKYRFLPDDAHNLSMLTGMFTGLGSALSFSGLFLLVRQWFTPAEKRRQEEIERNDERNQLITALAFQASAIVSILCMGVMAFVFVGLGYPIPAYIVIGGLYVQLAAMLLAKRIYLKKM